MLLASTTPHFQVDAPVPSPPSCAEDIPALPSLPQPTSGPVGCASATRQQDPLLYQEDMNAIEDSK